MLIVKCTDEDIRALAGIAINADDLKDDGFDYSTVRVNKPWGFEYERYRTAHLSVWWLHIKTNRETSMHAHTSKDTMLMIVGGEAEFSTLTTKHMLSEGDLVIIEKGAFHKTKALNSHCVLYEFETPANKKDLVRLSDAYGRGQGYEVCANTTP